MHVLTISIIILLKFYNQYKLFERRISRFFVKNTISTVLYFIAHLLSLSTTVVEPIELDALLEIIETGLGLRDEAPELGSDALNVHERSLLVFSTVDSFAIPKCKFAV